VGGLRSTAPQQRDITRALVPEAWERHERGDDSEPMLELDQRAVLGSVLVAAFCAAVAHALTCNEQHACLKAGTCQPTANATSLGCSFRTRITPAGVQMLNLTRAGDGTRGVCAPGLVQSASVWTDAVRCTRRRTYPNALNSEVALTAVQADAELAPEHRRWCGAWIDAQPQLLEETKWAFFDADAVLEDVDAVIAARGSSRLAGQDVAKFRASCRSMLASNALGTAATAAYEHLLAAFQLDNVVVSDRRAVLKAVGALASYACDAPATVGLTDAGATFAVKVATGVAVDGGALSDALYALGADRATRADARAFAEQMEDAMDAGAVAISADDADAVARGAHPTTASAEIAWEAQNAPLAAYAHIASVAPASVVHSYLRGLTAHCAFALRSAVAGELGGLTATTTAVGKRNAGTAPELRPRALGRLDGRVGAVFDAFVALNGTHLHAATSATWSGLLPIFDGASGRAVRAKTQCLAAARVVFPDAFDSLAFDTLVTSKLYARIGAMREPIRARVEEAVQRDAFAGTHGTAGQLLMKRNARDVTLRVAGAPRGSWGGRTAAFVPPSTASSDSALVIMLKQAKALFLDRVALATRRDSICEHPPLFDARVRNAYLVVSPRYACAMLLPGMLVPPFADERYDEESLYARIGFVIAHEFSHISSLTRYWNVDGVARMLVHDYASSMWPEALADRIAVYSLVQTGYVDPERLCAHVSQLWCARVGTFADRESEGRSHPLSNERGDALCAYLKTVV